jgi:hypothetical protein
MANNRQKKGGWTQERLSLILRSNLSNRWGEAHNSEYVEVPKVIGSVIAMSLELCASMIDYCRLFEIRCTLNCDSV